MWNARILLVAGVATMMFSPMAAKPIPLRAGDIAYLVDPATLQIDASKDGALVSVMPPLHAPEDVAVIAEGQGWRWNDAEGHVFHLSAEAGALSLKMSGAAGATLSWRLPQAATGTWLVPDGEGMAYGVYDPFWRADFRKERCLGGRTSLSFPAWSYLTANAAVSYALGDGFSSALCLHDENGLQAKLSHDFTDGAETLDLLFAIRPPDPLAPALFYRALLKARGQFKSFADKMTPDLPRLFGAPQAYVWGDGLSPAFLDDLKALGITRMVVTTSANMHTPQFAPQAFFKKAYALGYLAGPYELFLNGQPAATSDDPTSVWPGDLYPWACIHKADGAVMKGFGNPGCMISSQALLLRNPFQPANRYAQHQGDGASEVFVDSDGFGDLFEDHDPDHPMTKAQDSDNRLARLSMGIAQFHLVIGSEKVTAWSAPVTHFSHGGLAVHQSTIWPLLKSEGFGGWWPPARPTLFFKPYTPTADEAHKLFDSADRVPLFEAVFHDSVVTSDRWEFGLMKISGEERYRFALSLLYGAPTMWNLDRRELARTGAWLKAAQDDFQTLHGIDTPVALTGFAWLTPDRLVQQASYADGRVIIANFGQSPWQGLGPDCVRGTRTDRTSFDLCPPPDPPPYRP